MVGLLVSGLAELVIWLAGCLWHIHNKSVMMRRFACTG